MDKIDLVVRIKTGMLTAGEFSEYCVKILQGLQENHRIFRECFSWGKSSKDWTSIDPGSGASQSVILKHIYDDEINYENPNSSGSGFSWFSRSVFGHINSFSNTKKKGEQQYTLSIHLGSQDGLGTINLSFQNMEDTVFSSVEFYLKLIEYFSSLPGVTHAYVKNSKIFKYLAILTEDVICQTGWLTFINHLQMDQIATWTSIKTRRLNSGTVFILGDEIAELPDKILEEAKALRDVLKKSGFLSSKNL